MIEEFLVSELDTIPGLNGQFYPAAAPVGDVEPPFCLYSRISGSIQRDLNGDPVFYRDMYRLDLIGDDNDALCQLATAMTAQLSKTNIDSGDVYIFSAEVSPGNPDGFDLSLEAHRKSLSYAVTYWR